MKLLPVGKITHYYDKIGVAVVELSESLKTGDKIKISGHENEFKQTVSSLQVDYQKISQAKKGDVVGLKVDQKVKSGDLVYLESSKKS